MWTIRTFSVRPLIPNRLKDLRRLAHNLWWCWHPDAVELFTRLDEEQWERVNHNPVALLGQLEQEKLKQASEDEGFLAHLARVAERFDAYMTASTWYQKVSGLGQTADQKVEFAYFSAEFGLTDCLRIYSGGLGVLAGDHLKSASDQGLPLVGVGLLYGQGYFRQYLNADGWQQEAYPNYDYANSPIQVCTRDDGTPFTFELEFADHSVTVQVWELAVGRVTLYLLDTNVPSNSLADREITARLYGGDLEMRIKQEILLGIGGTQMLAERGITPDLYHINEGHSAFLTLERIRRLMEHKGLSFDEARETTVPGNVFTTHTPVPAGNDMFPAALMDKYFSRYYSQLGLSRKQFLALGRQNPKDDNEPFCMTVLALHLAGSSNGVSRLHGEVSRGLWRRVWPEVPLDEMPIGHVTNGVHTASWTSKDMVDLFDRYLGPKWQEETPDIRVWERILKIPNAELWRTHERCRERLVAYTRRQLRQQLIKRGATKTELAHAEEALDPEALSIGFARRFATYKRGTLLLRDVERIARLLSDQKRPVQIIFAGKAHPRDTEGKELVRHIIHLARSEEFRRKIVFLEDYGLDVARALVQGVDVWLNTPRRPMEASGTSGMKVACNGGLNMSVLDGWWVEGYNTDNGWAIGSGEVYEDPEYQDRVESEAIYDTLEKEVVPMFYDRGADGLPREWIERMKDSLASLCPVFSSARMVREYTQRFYIPGARQVRTLAEDNYARAVELANWKQKLFKVWPEIRIDSVEQSGDDQLTVGSELEVRTTIRLGELAPDDVDVQLYVGKFDGQGQLRQAVPVSMHCVHSNSQTHLYSGAIPCRRSGIQGYGIRILPKHSDMLHLYETGLVLWA